MKDQVSTVAEGIQCFKESLGIRFVSFYVLDDGDSVTVFDAGIPNSVVQWIDKGNITKPVNCLIISHSDVDHFGNTSNLRECYLDMETLCHSLDQRWIEDHTAIVQERYGFSHQKQGIGYSTEVSEAFASLCGGAIQVTQTIADGDKLTTGGRTWEVLHFPGHISLWLADEGILLMSDAVLGHGPPHMETGEPSIPSTHQDIQPYLETIERLSQLPVKLALAAHWHPMDGEAFTQLLADSKAQVQRDIEAIKEACAEKSCTFADQLNILNDKFRQWDNNDDINYIYALDGTLAYLISKGKIQKKDGQYHA